MIRPRMSHLLQTETRSFSMANLPSPCGSPRNRSDHPWVKAHPDYYVEGSEEARAASPENYLWVDTNRGPKIIAYGRDPNFPGWPDTLQLNYANPELQAARIDELVAIAGKCDGVRCDMAMLLLPEIFQRTWG